MKKFKFHTNIKCSSCEAKVDKVFKSKPGILNHEVDLENVKRPLTVEAEDFITEEQIIDYVRQAGFEAKKAKRFRLF